MNPDDGYALLRLAHYEVPGPESWSELAPYNPGAARLTVDGAAATLRTSTDRRSLLLPASDEPTDWLRLGEDAFFRYPVALLGPIADDLDAARMEEMGLWSDATRGAGGLVEVKLADGRLAKAVTCSTCHAGVRDGRLEVGAPNEKLRWNELGSWPGTLSPEIASAVAAWGPGRLDATTRTGTEPVRIPDLRPVLFETHLHHDATVRQVDETSLAIRIETLLITSSGSVVRPPREVALALARYVRSLADTLAESATVSGDDERGRSLFDSRCASCHAPPSLTGPPVPLDVVGTDPTVGLSADRGTGTYRVPSLRGVGSRGPLLHDGTVPRVDVLLDPRRLGPDYAERLHGVGAIQGHPFGLDLDEPDRAALTAYVRAL